MRAHGWKDANFSIGYASEQVDGLCFSCGRDGIVTIWKKGDIEIGLSDSVKKQKINFQKIISEKQNLKFYEEVIENNYYEKMKDEINKKKKVKLDRISKIKV